MKTVKTQIAISIDIDCKQLGIQTFIKELIEYLKSQNADFKFF